MLHKLALALLLLLVGATVSRPAAAQTRDAGAQLLNRYLAGDREVALPEPFDARVFTASLVSAVDKGLPGPPEQSRRGLAAFVLEAANARLDTGDVQGARTLLEWACSRVRAHQPADAFDTAWHAAALSVVEAFVDPAALEAHVQHSRSQLPGDPLLDLAWGIAAEQRASPLLTPQLPLDTPPVMLAVNQAQLDANVARIIDDAIERFAKAISHPVTAAEARVRTAHVRLMRHEAKDAFDVLAGADTGVREAWVVYLARLFRGQALEQLKRPDEAARAFSDALKIGPGGQSATLSLASLLYRRGQRDDGAALAEQVLAETDPISDPWWTYWAGSARLWTSRRTAMRSAIQ